MRRVACVRDCLARVPVEHAWQVDGHWYGGVRYIDVSTVAKSFLTPHNVSKLLDLLHERSVCLRAMEGMSRAAFCPDFYVIPLPHREKHLCFVRCRGDTVALVPESLAAPAPSPPKPTLLRPDQVAMLRQRAAGGNGFARDLLFRNRFYRNTGLVMP